VSTLTDPLGWFTLQYPDDWQTSTEDCVTTLQSPRGIGTVYVSGGRHSGGPLAGFGGADFLLRFLAHIGITVPADAVQDWQGVGCRMYSYRRADAGRYWRYWSITDDETALLVSYTCAEAQSEDEAAAVEEMVRSVRLYGTAARS
jgi:hypothetical protein